MFIIILSIRKKKFNKYKFKIKFRAIKLNSVFKKIEQDKINLIRKIRSIKKRKLKLENYDKFLGTKQYVNIIEKKKRKIFFVNIAK